MNITEAKVWRIAKAMPDATLMLWIIDANKQGMTRQKSGMLVEAL